MLGRGVWVCARAAVQAAEKKVRRVTDSYATRRAERRASGGARLGSRFMMRRVKPFSSEAVARKFQSYPDRVRPRLLALRDLIFTTAASIEGVGEIEETLKWGEPAYLTSQTKSGTTIRIDWKESKPACYAMYFHCQTNLVATFRATFPQDFTFEGNRAIVFREDEEAPMDALAYCVGLALTYRTRKPVGAAASRRR